MNRHSCTQSHASQEVLFLLDVHCFDITGRASQAQAKTALCPDGRSPRIRLTICSSTGNPNRVTRDPDLIVCITPCVEESPETEMAGQSNRHLISRQGRHALPSPSVFNGLREISRGYIAALANHAINGGPLGFRIPVIHVRRRFSLFNAHLFS